MKHWPLLFITIFGLLVRLYQLDTLPGEMWGDVIEHYKLIQSIKEGNLFYHYAFGGDGPLFSYIATLISLFTGLSFYSLKLTSVLIGTLLIPSTYFFAYALFPKQRFIALISAYLAAVSFWAITFSRQAKPYILVPVLTSLVIGLLIKKRFFRAGLVIGLGMYTQAAFWGVSLLVMRHWKTMTGFLLVASLFMYSVLTATTSIFGQSYIGEKFGNITIAERVEKIALNGLKSLQALWWQGEGSFRHTIPNQPHLDYMSGGLLILGLILAVTHLCKIDRKRHITALILIVIAFFAIQLPSWMDVGNPNSSPSMGRTIGILPLLFILMAYGLASILRLIPYRLLALGLGVVLLGTITIINFNHYFFIYPKTLPNQNTAYGTTIAATIDAEYPEAKLVLVDCCWGEAGQPEPNAIFFQLKRKHVITHLEFEGEESVDEKVITLLNQSEPTVFIVRPQAERFLNQLRETGYPYKEQLLIVENNTIARLLFFQNTE